MSLIKSLQCWAVLLISLSLYYPSLANIVDALPITPKYLLFLYSPKFSYCKHVWLCLGTFSGYRCMLWSIGIGKKKKKNSGDLKPTEAAQPMIGRSLWINTPVPSLSVETILRHVLQSPGHLQWYWAPVAHSRSQLINVPCIGFLPFSDSLLAFAGITSHLRSNPCLESALR